MSVVDTLKPSATQQDATGGGYVLDGANAFDASLATYSRVVAELNGQYAGQVLSGFGADTYPSGRVSVVLQLDLARFGWTAADRARVFFRSTHAGAFVNVAAFAVADLGTVLTPKIIDVTALAGSDPATGFEVAVQFLNDVVGEPPMIGS